MSSTVVDENSEKRCPSCNNVKPLSAFYRDTSRKDGHASRCKKCHNVSVRKWQFRNKETIKAARAEWRKTHREPERQYSKKWAKEHPVRTRDNYTRWRNENPEYGKIWRRNNKDKIRHYAQNRRARLEANGGTLTVEEWNDILDFYGHKCLCCGRTDVKLTIDHVIPTFHGGKHCAENVQPLCGPCNSRKKDKVIDYRKEYYAPTRD